MKTVGCKCIAMILISLYALAVTAQNDVRVTVTNVRSAKGKVMIATDKGQYSMVDATGKDAVLELKNLPEGKYKLYVYHDENGNNQLDRENGVPSENCAIVDFLMQADTKIANIVLVDVRTKKEKTTIE